MGRRHHGQMQKLGINHAIHLSVVIVSLRRREDLSLSAFISITEHVAGTTSARDVFAAAQKAVTA